MAGCAGPWQEGRGLGCPPGLGAAREHDLGTPGFGFMLSRGNELCLCSHAKRTLHAREACRTSPELRVQQACVGPFWARVVQAPAHRCLASASRASCHLGKVDVAVGNG